MPQDGNRVAEEEGVHSRGWPAPLHKPHDVAAGGEIQQPGGEEVWLQLVSLLGSQEGEGVGPPEDDEALAARGPFQEDVQRQPPGVAEATLGERPGSREVQLPHEKVADRDLPGLGLP